MEPWVPGHAKNCKGKQLHSLVLFQDEQGQEKVSLVQDDDEGPTEEADPNHIPNIHTLRISLHALYGTSSPISTFTLQVQIGTKIATTLVDSGSDVSFINAKFAVKSRCKISSTSKVQIATADGKLMMSESACISYPYEIQQHKFSSDFRLLDVQGYDIILGADWIYQHSPIGLNLKTRELSITKQGEGTVTLSDSHSTKSKQLIGAKKLCHLLKTKSIAEMILLRPQQVTSETESKVIPEAIQNLINQYNDIFQEPQELPPMRSIDHTIPLINEKKAVTQRA